jgi:misacylated tRNA(Ala) deacylase
MTQPLFRDDPYLREAEATVLAVTDAGVELDRSLFYAASGGQPADFGSIERGDGSSVPVAGAVYGEDKRRILIQTEAAELAAGDQVLQHLDWDRRYRHMRMHTALHLLSVILPYPVTGGAIGAEEGRLDFDIPDPDLDAERISAEVMVHVDADHAVTTEWITDEELLANPGLVKTMSVKPPVGQGRVRLVRIGDIDLQPCGGTHVARTGEIGLVAVSKIEKKGRLNRRVRLRFIGE